MLIFFAGVLITKIAWAHINPNHPDKQWVSWTHILLSCSQLGLGVKVTDTLSANVKCGFNRLKEKKKYLSEKMLQGKTFLHVVITCYIWPCWKSSPEWVPDHLYAISTRHQIPACLEPPPSLQPAKSDSTRSWLQMVALFRSVLWEEKQVPVLPLMSYKYRTEIWVIFLYRSVYIEKTKPVPNQIFYSLLFSAEFSFFHALIHTFFSFPEIPFFCSWALSHCVWEEHTGHELRARMCAFLLRVILMEKHTEVTPITTPEKVQVQLSHTASCLETCRFFSDNTCEMWQKKKKKTTWLNLH